jgi:hypothetical protein
MIKRVITWKYFLKKSRLFQGNRERCHNGEIDNEGNVIGFSILKLSVLKEQKPISIGLRKHVA